ncbi:MAG: hypothetical protein KDE59_30950 [Anaerolineales bacterium]|nr:hypothetical protein [Anaerolineales bacterium]
MTLIQIHRHHLSAHASEADALAFVEALKAKGWPVTYTTEEYPMWRFPEAEQLFKFERDFDNLHEVHVPPFRWQVAFDVTNDPLAGIEGEIQEQAQHIPHIEYGDRNHEPND